MLGVLVVADAVGHIGYLRAFSGMVAGRWDHAGWAPPVFDRDAHALIWGPGESRLESLATERTALSDATAQHAQHDAVHQITRTMTATSQSLLPQLQETYHFSNARGETRTMRDLFAPGEPPGGAGDCAGPKLLAEAYRHGLRPLAMAELWWGASPETGDRRPGTFYAACRGKCGPILSHMLGGLTVDAAPLHGSAAIAATEPAALFDDAWITVVSKPCGLLSVPGRSARLRDSVLTRLQARFPDATGAILVHRLDLDTSGVMLAAKDGVTYAALQRQFALRTVTKRYIAWLDGRVSGDSGTIALPLRVDVDDRPRQIHDPAFGKPAITDWQVLTRTGDRTRVALFPRTGRTHQLRVHCANPAGLDAPIVGDRLYGRSVPEPDARLLLHAERLEFVHPATGASVTIDCPAPF